MHVGHGDKRQAVLRKREKPESAALAQPPRANYITTLLPPMDKLLEWLRHARTLFEEENATKFDEFDEFEPVSADLGESRRRCRAERCDRLLAVYELYEQAWSVSTRLQYLNPGHPQNSLFDPQTQQVRCFCLQHLGRSLPTPSVDCLIQLPIKGTSKKAKRAALLALGEWNGIVKPHRGKGRICEVEGCDLANRDPFLSNGMKHLIQNMTHLHGRLTHADFHKFCPGQACHHIACHPVIKHYQWFDFPGSDASVFDYHPNRCILHCWKSPEKQLCMVADCFASTAEEYSYCARHKPMAIELEKQARRRLIEKLTPRPKPVAPVDPLPKRQKIFHDGVNDATSELMTWEKELNTDNVIVHKETLYELNDAAREEQLKLEEEQEHAIQRQSDYFKGETKQVEKLVVYNRSSFASKMILPTEKVRIEPEAVTLLRPFLNPSLTPDEVAKKSFVTFLSEGFQTYEHLSTFAVQGIAMGGPHGGIIKSPEAKRIKLMFLFTPQIVATARSLLIHYTIALAVEQYHSGAKTLIQRFPHVSTLLKKGGKGASDDEIDDIIGRCSTEESAEILAAMTDPNVTFCRRRRDFNTYDVLLSILYYACYVHDRLPPRLLFFTVMRSILEKDKLVIDKTLRAASEDLHKFLRKIICTARTSSNPQVAAAFPLYTPERVAHGILNWVYWCCDPLGAGRDAAQEFSQLSHQEDAAPMMVQDLQLLYSTLRKKPNLRDLNKRFESCDTVLDYLHALIDMYYRYRFDIGWSGSDVGSNSYRIQRFLQNPLLKGDDLEKRDGYAVLGYLETIETMEAYIKDIDITPALKEKVQSVYYTIRSEPSAEKLPVGLMWLAMGSTKELKKTAYVWTGISTWNLANVVQERKDGPWKTDHTFFRRLLS
jgi:hypothetical protein